RLFVLYKCVCVSDGLWVVTLCVLSYFFFFQAEDGIRDSSVTGVQTCALPISCCVEIGTSIGISLAPQHGRDQEHLLKKADLALRSEERRVGKECRSRWSGWYLKKKEGRKIKEDDREIIYCSKGKLVALLMNHG